MGLKAISQIWKHGGWSVVLHLLKCFVCLTFICNLKSKGSFFISLQSADEKANPTATLHWIKHDNCIYMRGYCLSQLFLGKKRGRNGTSVSTWCIKSPILLKGSFLKELVFCLSVITEKHKYASVYFLIIIGLNPAVEHQWYFVHLWIWMLNQGQNLFKVGILVSWQFILNK